MQEVRVKTHLITTSVHEEFNMDWCGRMKDAQPLLKNGLPVFVIIGDGRRMELNTADMRVIEDAAKHMTHPRGRQAITKDIAKIYIKEVNGNEKLAGKFIHRHIRTYAPMYDPVGYRD